MNLPQYNLLWRIVTKQILYSFLISRTNEFLAKITLSNNTNVDQNKNKNTINLWHSNQNHLNYKQEENATVILMMVNNFY